MRQNSTSRKKKTPRASAKKRLDEVFSKWVRLSHADSNGFCICITCGKRLHWKEITNGHYVTRGHMGTRFDAKNCAPQCWGCNSKYLGNGRKDKHAIYIMDKYGPDELRRLDAAASSITKLNTYDLNAMISLYERELEKFVSISAQDVCDQ